MCRVRCRVRSSLRVGVGVGVEGGFKYSVGVLHRLGGDGCYVGKGNEKFFRARSAPPYVWPVAIDFGNEVGPEGREGQGGVVYPNRGDGPPVGLNLWGPAFWVQFLEICFFGSQFFGLRIFGCQILGSPLFASRFFASRVFGSVIFGSTVLGSGISGTRSLGFRFFGA